MGAGPAFGFTASINADPLFAILTTITKDFHLRVGSHATDTGTNTGIATDFDGVTRPQRTAFDIGAFECTSTVQQPNSPTNLRVSAVP